MSILDEGFNPIAITIMNCEETFVFETKEESIEAFNKFSPDCWWYSKEEFKTSYLRYVYDVYDGDINRAPKVYWL
jgi:hypothetical protein